MNQTIIKSFKDIFSSTVLFFVTKITIISIAVTALLIWLLGGMLTGFITSYLSWIPWEWIQTTGASVVTVAIAYMLFIIVLSIIPVVGSPNITTSILLSLKSGLIFLILFLFTFPIMFIPLIGAVWMLWLWSILLKAPTIYDVSTLFISDKAHMKEKTKKSTLMAMIAAGFNYIPVLNIFAPVFAQILFLHHILGKK